MHTITVKIPDVLERRLSCAARKQHTTRSDLVRHAIENYVENDLPRQDRPTAFDLLGEFIGSVEGPEDLATGQRHLEGYGR